MGERQGVRVSVFRRGDRKFYQAEWKDPVTGKSRSKSLGTASLKEAQRLAGRLESEINSGLFAPPTRVTWTQFRKRHEAEFQPPLRKKTRGKYAAIFNHVERLIRPKYVSSITRGEIQRLAILLTQEGQAELTVRTSIGYLRAALKWAKEVGIINVAPPGKLPTASKKSRGRALTDQELAAMLDKTAEVVGEDRADAFKRLQEGLVLSGLRLGEALILKWDQGPMRVRLDAKGQHPMLEMESAGQKSKRNELCPMAPEFAEFLRQTPKALRHGFVFELPLERPDLYEDPNSRPELNWISRLIQRIGCEAGVVVGHRRTRPKDGSEPTTIAKYASAHDLRRTFGFRWAMRVMPPVLQSMMRHKSIETTLAFYVGQDAQRMAEVIHQAAEASKTAENTGD